MRFYLRILCLVAVSGLAWPMAAQAQQVPADDQQKLNGALEYLAHFAVRRVIEAVSVDTTEVASFERDPDAEAETWSLTGTAAITDLSGNLDRQPYSARLEIRCDSYARSGCWDIKSLTLGQRTFSGDTPTVVTLAELNEASQPGTEAAAGTPSKEEALDALGGAAQGEGGTGQDIGQDIGPDIGPDIGLLQTMAEKGDPDAQYQLAEKYRIGFPVNEDHTKALELYNRSAGQGFASSQFRLGELYEEGEIVERDLGKALEAYREAAEQGHPGAQYALAHIYHLGSGVEQDMAAAMVWYRKAALQGDEWSQLALGDQYRIGLAVPRDLAQSTEWYRRAADQGNIFAQFELGNAYRYGNGVEPDVTQAIRWYRLSAEAGNPSAQLALTELDAGDTATAGAPAPDPVPQPVPQPVPLPAPGPEATQGADSGDAATGSEPESGFSETDMARIAEEKAARDQQAADEAASGGEPALAPTPSSADEEAVQQLLTYADYQVANLALTTPPGDNAYETYRQVLSIQPDNQTALDGIEQIGVDYAALAERAEARGGTEQARKYLNKALQLAPNHPDVQAVAAALQSPKPAGQTAAPAAPAAAAEAGNWQVEGSSAELVAPSTPGVAVAVAPPAPSTQAPAAQVPSSTADIAVSALTDVPGVTGAAGGSETVQVPRSQAPKPELLTSGLLYAVSGLDAHQAGRYEEAIEFYTLAVEAGDLPDRSLAYVHNNRGASYRNLGRFNEAIEEYDAAIRLNPDYATAFYNRGIAYDRKGFHELAIDDFDTAIRLNPDLSDAYNQRGIAYARDGRYDIAIENFSQAIRLDPQLDSAYFNRGLAYHSKGESNRAAEDIKKSYALNPNNPEYGEKMRELGIL